MDASTSRSAIFGIRSGCSPSSGSSIPMNRGGSGSRRIASRVRYLRLPSESARGGNREIALGEVNLDSARIEVESVVGDAFVEVGEALSEFCPGAWEQFQVVEEHAEVGEIFGQGTGANAVAQRVADGGASSELPGAV